ncbi:MAG TPA: acyl-CoA dehydrogenase family protein [Micromonosporaceae bacterium]
MVTPSADRWDTWWSEHATDRLSTGDAAALVAAALADGLLDLPLPGAGATEARLAMLSRWGRADLVFARLAEGHVDAVAILAELGGPPPGEDLWAVWAAVPQSVRATRRGDDWVLDGDRPWCSGAGLCTRALVTAAAEDGPRLFAIDVADATVLPDTWPAVGMAGSDSRTIRLAGAPGTPVGGPDGYVNRPGFRHGGIGVAACWYGGARGVADALVAAARSKDVTPHAMAHLGGVDVALHSSRTLLADAAAAIDADPLRDRTRLSSQVRQGVEARATEVLDRVGRALGASPLCMNHAHARRVADLTVYLRQSHAEADLAGLGSVVRDGDDPAW